MKPRRFAGKVVFLTGASSGIGAALARAFVREGAAVALFARRAERLEKLRGELEAKGGSALVCVGDVTQDGDLESAVARAVESFGRIDVAVANAGFGILGYFEKLSLEDYRRQFETNVFGLMRTAKACLAELKKSQGRLVLVGSVNGYLAFPKGSGYAMSKFAVRALAETLYAELASSGVSVTLISPGLVTSEIRRVDNQGRYRPEAKDVAPIWLKMSADKAARKILSAVFRRRRERILTLHGKALVWLSRFFPGLIPCFFRWIASRHSVGSDDLSV